MELLVTLRVDRPIDDAFVDALDVAGVVAALPGWRAELLGRAGESDLEFNVEAESADWLREHLDDSVLAGKLPDDAGVSGVSVERHRVLGRWRVPATIAAVALAVVGVALYARDPDVGSYWMNAILVAPLLVLVLVALQDVLPRRVQWIAAWVILPAGPIAYLVWPNEQWWNYGALTTLPLMLLADQRQDRLRRERGLPDEPNPGMWGDGPWGPP